MRFPAMRLLFSLHFAPCLLPAAEIHLAQGLLAGEVAADSAILQSRLTAVPSPSGGGLPGAPGTGRFEISEDAGFKEARTTAWLRAGEESDFILKARIDGLKPGTLYHYRVVGGPEEQSAKPLGEGTFKTLPDPSQAVPVDFIVTSCLNHAFFMNGTRGFPAAEAEDRAKGYPALDAVLRLKPDFVILNGDCVYYDHPEATRAKTLAEMRTKWHEQYAMPRFVRLFAGTPTYWLKDDHDHRRNDSDTTGDYEPSHPLGMRVFREQVPVVAPGDEDAVTYRTHRMGRDLQLWFVEGRDYRSPNKMADGPGKSIWGKEQKAWLEKTLRESDATFKILVSPTPMIGPDDGYKSDNHANLAGFRHEGEAFFDGLKAAGIGPGRFFVICGDRHWKYHSRHPDGFEEFSCGALNRENARLGRAPGTKGSSDPEGKVVQPYTDRPPSGGFLRVELSPAADGKPARLAFTHHDDRGAIQYRHEVR